MEEFQFPTSDVSGLTFQGMHCGQNRGYDVFVADCGIDHHVIERAGGPICAEVMLYKLHAVAVNRVYQFLRFFVPATYLA